MGVGFLQVPNYSRCLGLYFFYGYIADISYSQAILLLFYPKHQVVTRQHGRACGD